MAKRAIALHPTDKAAAERVAFFSDAVVAIAITLLALDLPVPTGSTMGQVGRFLADHREAFIGFGISFLVIGLHWVGHHAVFRHLERASPALVRVNLIWLLSVVLTPWATRTLTFSNPPSVVDTSNPLRFVIYAGVQVLGDGAFLIMLLLMQRQQLLAADTPPFMWTTAWRRLLANLVAFGGSIPVFFFWADAWVLWIVVSIGVAIGLRLFGRRPPVSATK